MGAAPRGISPRPRALHRPRTPRHPPRAHPCTSIPHSCSAIALDDRARVDHPHWRTRAYHRLANVCDTHSRNRHVKLIATHVRIRLSMYIRRLPIPRMQDTGIKHLVRGEAWWCIERWVELGSRGLPRRLSNGTRRLPSASLDPGEGTEIISLLDVQTRAILNADRSTWDGAAPRPRAAHGVTHAP